MDWGTLLTAAIAFSLGSLVTLGSQWLFIRRHERLERAKWEHEDSRERRVSIRDYRKARAEPVFEALDRAQARWHFETAVELGESIGYRGEEVTGQASEEMKQRHREYKAKLFGTLHEDISMAMRIPDDEVRRYVVRALWQNAEIHAMDGHSSAKSYDLGEACRKVESWIFER